MTGDPFPHAWMQPAQIPPNSPVRLQSGSWPQHAQARPADGVRTNVIHAERPERAARRCIAPIPLDPRSNSIGNSHARFLGRSRQQSATRPTGSMVHTWPDGRGISEFPIRHFPGRCRKNLQSPVAGAADTGGFRAAISAQPTSVRDDPAGNPTACIARRIRYVVVRPLMNHD